MTDRRVRQGNYSSNGIFQRMIQVDEKHTGSSLMGLQLTKSGTNLSIKPDNYGNKL